MIAVDDKQYLSLHEKDYGPGIGLPFLILPEKDLYDRGTHHTAKHHPWTSLPIVPTIFMPHVSKLEIRR